MGDGKHREGVSSSCIAEAAFLHTSKPSSSQQSDEQWANGESRIAELLSHIQPNGHSELQRKAVADYVSGLVQKCLDCKVFRFGSVPLKTYLPDGDIDLTAFSSHQELRDSWALDVQTILEQELQRKDTDFTVSDVQCIHAEVKIVKCVVENIVVDISFNQLGGLCTLCFLEEVDRLIQKNHLFKRSIILVKAWCYYESRILGAHHALISTYALETLVLYIFNVFHSSLRGPLEVLFTFLDYFSKFDWENYCVTLWGPVPSAALPDLTDEPPLKDGSKLLLSKGFLEACSDLYDVFPKGGDIQARTFSRKYLNIVDPLRTNNNLGRSVSQANFHRIKKAFRTGACQLAEVFKAGDEDFLRCLKGFFSNTWERHQTGHRPDAPTSFSRLYEKSVYRTGCLEMPGDGGARCLFTPPEFKPSGLFSTEKINENENSSSPLSDSRTLMEVIRFGTAEDQCGGYLQSQDLKALHGFPQVKENQVHSCHNEITHLACPVIDRAPKTKVTMQSTLTCNMPIAVSTDSQLRTSSLRKTSLDADQSMEACKAPVSLTLSTSHRGQKERLDADMMKSWYSLETMQPIEVWESPLKKDSPGVYEGPWEGGQDAGTEKARKAVRDTFAVTHGQGSGHISFVRGKINRCDGSKISAGTTTISNNIKTCSISSASEELITSDTFMQKPPDFLFPESRDLLYAPFLPSNFPPVPSSSSSAVTSSPFPHLSTFSELDGERAQDLPCQAFKQAKPYQMRKETSEGPASEDVQSCANPMPQLHAVIVPQTPSEHQVFEEQKQYRLQPQQTWSQSKVDWEQSNMHLCAPNDQPTTSAEANGGNDESNIKRGGCVTGHMAIEAQQFSRTETIDEKLQPSIGHYYDAHHLSTSKANLDKFREGLGSVGAIEQQPFNSGQVFQSGMFGSSMASASLVHGGDNYIAQGPADLCSPTGAIPLVSYYNPFYPLFLVHSFSTYIPYEHEVFLDGVPRKKPPHEYHSFRRIAESTAAALSTRFASLSAEESGIDPPKDLLRSDLANHLQNLEFGRWCQEPVLQPLPKLPPTYHGGQGVSSVFPFQGSCNQMVDSSNSLVPVLIAAQNVGGMSHVVTGPGTSDIGQRQTQETTFLPVRNGVYRELKPLNPQIAQKLDQGPTKKKTHFSSTNLASAASALAASASCHGAYHSAPNIPAFANTAEEHGAIDPHFSNPLQSTGRVLPLLAGQLEFGSLGPIDITNFPCSKVGTK
ncbi:hypothetical protein GOP47_0028520 [Adiantum capillus-veneris]|nr:hypothetical protein GOP47_0028520 [Adiantum capillus-veneris]